MSERLPRTISLIGMPGAGKSTVGRALADLTGMRFFDSDREIERREGATLQEIVDRRGYLALWALDERILLEAPLEDAVVSTGGSAVYSEAAMARLAAAGPVLYLQVDLETLRRRIAANPPRGLAARPGHDLAAVYAERLPLYRRHATATVNAASGPPREVAARLLAALGARR